MTHSLRQQRTISRRSHVEGFGYWSGQDIQIEFRPAPENTGIVFVRTELGREIRIPATVGQRVEVPRRTNLVADGAKVEMVEHVMAALAGLQIDNCEIWASAAEMPGCDGSSQPFVAALQSAGTHPQSASRVVHRIDHVTRVGDADHWVEARPSANDEFSIRCEIDYDDVPAIGRQYFELTVTPESFRQQLSPARTFILSKEAQWLRSQGLGQRVTPGDLLVFGDDGLVDNELRFPDECIRHKALDLVGDLALAGCDLVGDFTAYCSGHRLNAELVKTLLARTGVRKSA